MSSLYFRVFRIILIKFLIIELTLSSKEKVEHPSCKERRNLMGLKDNADDYILAEAYIGEEVQLDCHYCNEDDEIRKIWYIRDRFFHSPPTEIVQDFTHVDVEKRKIVVNEHHTLIIRNVTEKDGGIYFCQGIGDTSSKFNYIVDITGDKEPFSSIKTSDEVSQFIKDKIKPLNTKLAKEEPFKVGNSDSEEVHFKIHLEWSEWGRCKVCNRIAGVRKRAGKFELRPSKEKYHKNFEDKSKTRSAAFKRMKFGIGFSCHSLLLEKLVSHSLARDISDLPALVETEHCSGNCMFNLHIHKQTIAELTKEISEADTNDANFVLVLDLDSQSEQSTVIEVVNVTVKEFGKPFHLFCPIGTEEGEIVWVKGKTIVKKGKRMEVDILDRLLLKKLNLEDLGEYSCTTEKKETAILKLELVETRLRLSRSQIIYIWSTFIVVVLSVWCCCVTVIYLNHKKVSKEFLRRISLEYDAESYPLLKEV